MNDNVTELPDKDGMTHDRKWAIVSVELEKHGMDVRRPAKITQASIIAQLEADEVVGADEDVWRDWVNEYLKEHISYALPRWHRRTNAEDLLNGWHQGWDDPASDPDIEELVENRYALVAWYDGNSHVYTCGNTIESVLEVIAGLTYEAEYPELPEFFMDLDDGKVHKLYGRDAEPVETTIKMRWGGFEITKRYGRDEA